MQSSPLTSFRTVSSSFEPSSFSEAALIADKIAHFSLTTVFFVCQLIIFIPSIQTNFSYSENPKNIMFNYEENYKN